MAGLRQVSAALGACPGWLRAMVVVAGVCMAMCLGHVVFLTFRPDVRRNMRFPPLPPPSIQYPPLPFIEDVDLLLDFFHSSLDDVVEDIAKGFCVALSYSLGWSLVGDRSYVAANFAGIVVGTGTYMICDCIGDTAGDAVANSLTIVAENMGYIPPPTKEKREKDTSLLSRVADDAMEDSFKLICLWSHWTIGGFLGDQLVVNTFGMQSNLLKWMLRLGIPATKYNLCNAYSDYLGEWVRYHIGYMVESFWLSGFFQTADNHMIAQNVDNAPLSKPKATRQHSKTPLRSYNSKNHELQVEAKAKVCLDDKRESQQMYCTPSGDRVITVDDRGVRDDSLIGYDESMYHYHPQDNQGN